MMEKSQIDFEINESEELNVSRIDSFLNAEDFKLLSTSLIAAPYQLWRIDDKDIQGLAGSIPCDYMQFELEREDFKTHKSFQLFEKTAIEYLKTSELELDRVFCNAFQFGDATFTHKDEIGGKKGVSMLLFLNQEWDFEWGGELLFFTDSLEASKCVSPKPNRLVVFSNTINHRPGLPNRSCPDIRITMNVRFKIC